MLPVVVVRTEPVVAAAVLVRHLLAAVAAVVRAVPVARELAVSPAPARQRALAGAVVVASVEVGLPEREPSTAVMVLPILRGTQVTVPVAAGLAVLTHRQATALMTNTSAALVLIMAAAAARLAAHAAAPTIRSRWGQVAKASSPSLTRHQAVRLSTLIPVLYRRPHLLF